MIGYAFLDIEDHLCVRTQRYIEEENPNFFGTNKHWVVKYWKFDTEDKGLMRKMFLEIGMRRLPEATVKLFAQSIGFDLKSLMAFLSDAPPAK